MTPVTSHRGDLRVVAVSGSPSRESRSRLLLRHALEEFTAAGAATSMVDLADLSAGDLLGRTRTPSIAGALADVGAAHVLVVGTPVYRASYSGLLKVFFDLLPPDALADKVAIPVATGGASGHQLVLDHALRPLLASLAAVVVSRGVYATDDDAGANGLHPALIKRLNRAVAEALALAGGSAPVRPPAGPPIQR